MWYQLNSSRLILVLALLLAPLTGCTSFLIDQYHPYIRSDQIKTPEQEAVVLSKARLTWTTDGRVRVLYVSGTPYERGYQQGALLREEVRDNLLTLISNAIDKYPVEEIMYEAFERQRRYIPEEYLEEMRGLAHGAKLPLSVVHGIHALPEIGEWGGRKDIKKTALEILARKLGTSCSNFSGINYSSPEYPFLAVRILDWGMHRISKLHEYPLILVSQSEGGQLNANITWIGFLGAVSGMNAAGITLGEMGYGDPPGETLFGKPMPFLLRDILSYTTNLDQVRSLIQSSPPTNSFVYLITDGKTKDAELYIRDPSRFVVFKAGQTINEERKHFPGIEGIVYGGHYEDKMINMMQTFKDQFTPEVIMKTIIPDIAMPSNFQNVIYDPIKLRFWVSNAKSKDEPAYSQPYSEFHLTSRE